MQLPPFLYDLLQKMVHTDYSLEAGLILDAYRPFAGEPVLELGSGTGVFSRFFPDHTYTGIDNDPARVELAQQRYPRAEFLLGDATDLPREMLSRFRFIFCHAWIHHIPDAACARIFGSIAESATEHEVHMIILEPLLDRFWGNPFGYALAKLDRGRYVRTAAHMEKILAPYLTAQVLSKPRWKWPLPGGAFTLKFPVVGKKQVSHAPIDGTAR